MKTLKTLSIFSILFFTSNAFSMGDDSFLAKDNAFTYWTCFMDVRETRNERGGEPLIYHDNEYEKAYDGVLARCLAYHEGRYPGLCDEIVERKGREAIVCQKRLGRNWHF